MRSMRNTGRTSMRVTQLLILGLLALHCLFSSPMLTQMANGNYWRGSPRIEAIGH